MQAVSMQLQSVRGWTLKRTSCQRSAAASELCTSRVQILGNHKAARAFRSRGCPSPGRSSSAPAPGPPRRQLARPAADETQRCRAVRAQLSVGYAAYR